MDANSILKLKHPFNCRTKSPLNTDISITSAFDSLMLLVAGRLNLTKRAFAFLDLLLFTKNPVAERTGWL